MKYKAVATRFTFLACTFSSSFLYGQEQVSALLDRIVLMGDKVNRMAYQVGHPTTEGHQESLCALTETGRIFCAGHNNFGQLGRSLRSNLSKQVPIEYGNPAELIQPDFPMGAYFVDLGPQERRFDWSLDDSFCALDLHGNMFCWGKMLGDGCHEQVKPLFMNPPGVQFERMSLEYGGAPCAIDVNGVGYCLIGGGITHDKIDIRDRREMWRKIDHGTPIISVVSSWGDARNYLDHCAILKVDQQVVCQMQAGPLSTDKRGSREKKARQEHYREIAINRLERYKSKVPPALLPDEQGLPSEIARHDQRVRKLIDDLRTKYLEVQAQLPIETERINSCFSRISSPALDNYNLKILLGSTHVIPLLQSARFSGYGWDDLENFTSLEPVVDIKYVGLGVAGRVDQWGQFVYQIIRAEMKADGGCSFSKSELNRPVVYTAERLFGKAIPRPVEHLSTTLTVNYSAFSEASVNQIFGGNVVTGFNVVEGRVEMKLQIEVQTQGERAIESKVIEIGRPIFYPLDR